MKARATAVLVLTVFGLVASVVIAGCGPTGNYMNHGKSNAFSDCTDYQGMWLNNELEYIVFIPSEVPLSSRSFQWHGMKPSAKGLTVIPEGLYNNGNLIDTSGMRKVFVLRKDGKLWSIQIDQKHLPYLKYSNIQQLEQSPVWPFFQKAIHGTEQKILNTEDGEVKVLIDRIKCAKLGVRIKAIAEAIEQHASKASDLSLTELKSIKVRTFDGNTVELGAIATITLPDSTTQKKEED